MARACDASSHRARRLRRLSLLTDVLDTRRGSGALPVALRSHSWPDVVNVMEDVAKLFSLPAADAGHALSVDAALVAPAPPQDARLDLARLAQVLTNFMSNAVKYTPTAGHIRVCACVDERDPRDPACATSRGLLAAAAGAPAAPAATFGALGRDMTGWVSDGTRWLHIAVKDTGGGLSPEGLARLCVERGLESAAPGSDGGSGMRGGARHSLGLGIHLCASLVERMGGQMTVASARGVGTSASVSFPLLPAAAAGAISGPLKGHEISVSSDDTTITRVTVIHEAVKTPDMAAAGRTVVSPAVRNRSLASPGMGTRLLGLPPAGRTNHSLVLSSTAALQLAQEDAGRTTAQYPTLLSHRMTSPSVAAREMGHLAAVATAREGYARLGGRRVLVVGELLLGPDFIGFLRSHVKLSVDVVRARACAIVCPYAHAYCRVRLAHCVCVSFNAPLIRRG